MTVTALADISRQPPKKCPHLAFIQAARLVAELREYGPRYAPTAWFGGGQPIPEKYRVRLLRAAGRAAGRLTVRAVVVKGR